jgi:ADP-heptose:LPS heptosyltransferase
MSTATISDPDRLDAKRVTLVYTMFNHLGDFVVMAALLKKYDLLNVEFQSLVAHPNSTHIASFAGKTEGRFFNIFNLKMFLGLIALLRRRRGTGEIILGIPMAPGSIQAFIFFWMLKTLGAITHIVDFNLVNADVITPPRARYIYNRHLAQASEIFKRPEWLEDKSMPLGLSAPISRSQRSGPRVGFFPWTARSHMPEFTWQMEKWSELASLILADSRLDLVLFGRDARFSEFHDQLRTGLAEEMRPRFSAAPVSSVEELLAALGDLDYLVTVNTSALHLAHSLKLSIVVLSGSSLELWLPEGDHVRVVRDENGALPPSDIYRHDSLQPSLQRIDVRYVHEAFLDLRRRFPNSP